MGSKWRDPEGSEWIFRWDAQGIKIVSLCGPMRKLSHCDAVDGVRYPSSSEGWIDYEGGSLRAYALENEAAILWEVGVISAIDGIELMGEQPSADSGAISR